MKAERPSVAPAVCGDCGHLKYSHRVGKTMELECTALIMDEPKRCYCGCRKFVPLNP